MSDVLDQAIAAIREPDAAVGAEVQRRLDEKTKPRGSLGGLERLAVRIASIQRTAEPSLGTPVVVVCAADHGVAAEGVSAFPSSVTAQMVANYAGGGAAVSVLARRAGATLVVVDCGVAEPLPVPGVLDRRLGAGTASMLHGPAMRRETRRRGARDRHRAGRRATRRRGLRRARRDGNRQLDGRGGALLCAGRRDARAGLRPWHGPRRRGPGAQARRRHARARAQPAERVRSRRARSRPWADSSSACSRAWPWARPRVAFPCSSTATSHRRPCSIAAALAPALPGSLIAAHRSSEPGHALVLAALGLQPLLDLELRLGEGSGAALALPLLGASLAILDEMATFASAGVDDSGR